MLVRLIRESVLISCVHLQEAQLSTAKMETAREEVEDLYEEEKRRRYRSVLPSQAARD